MKWYLKQLIPMTYRTKCEMGDKNYFVVWKMWFGRCYKQDWIEMA
ncbi:hypothetical protein [Paraliobacillus ryukyuensis]|nr:hypothetical protein [Paraliobacillus ryukyuensis]